MAIITMYMIILSIDLHGIDLIYLLNFLLKQKRKQAQVFGLRSLVTLNVNHILLLGVVMVLLIQRYDQVRHGQQNLVMMVQTMVNHDIVMQAVQQNYHLFVVLLLE